MNIIVTGAGGFIGSAFLKKMKAKGRNVVGLYRNEKKVPKDSYSAKVCDYDANTDWSGILKDVDVVVHAAGIAHVNNNNNAEVKSDFKEINIRSTANLARQAALMGVKRFIFLSSIGVNGNKTSGKPFSHDDEPNPQDLYSISKWEAEEQLRKICSETGMEFVIIRPPLVYGYNAPGNFYRLFSSVECGKILPLGLVENKRTFVGINNLIDLIEVCIFSSKASNQVILAGDEKDISVKDFVLCIGDALGVKVKLLPIPVSWMRTLAKAIGRLEMIDKICNDLQIDVGRNYELLGWRPSVSLEDGLREIVMEKN